MSEYGEMPNRVSHPMGHLYTSELIPTKAVLL